MEGRKLVISLAVVTTKEGFRSQIPQRKEESLSLSSSQTCRKNPSQANICNKIMDLCQTLMVEEVTEGCTIKILMTKIK